MKAVDTNILVRWITRDDPEQALLADAVVAQPILVSLTVLLELAWVLGGKTFRYERARLARVLTALLDVTTITVPAREEVRWAVRRFAAGADIAGMLHIVAARGSAGFVSFENHLADLAGDGSPLAIERPA